MNSKVNFTTNSDCGTERVGITDHASLKALSKQSTDALYNDALPYGKSCVRLQHTCPQKARLETGLG